MRFSSAQHEAAGVWGVANESIEVLTEGMVAYWPLDENTTEQARGNLAQIWHTIGHAGLIRAQS